MEPMMVEAEPMGGTAAISQPTKFWPKMGLAIYPKTCLLAESLAFHFAHSMLSHKQIALYVQ